MKIKHILVSQKYEAEDLLRRLDAGESFEDLARKYSKCSSANSGGNLGVFDSKQKLTKLDADFLDAVELLKPDQISKPIRTRFGYHLIVKSNS